MVSVQDSESGSLVKQQRFDNVIRRPPSHSRLSEKLFCGAPNRSRLALILSLETWHCAARVWHHVTQNPELVAAAGSLQYRPIAFEFGRWQLVAPQHEDYKKAARTSHNRGRVCRYLSAF